MVLPWCLVGIAALVLLSFGAAAQQGLRSDRLTNCAACHGADGVSTIETIPSLAGQTQLYLTDQLVLIREGVRKIDAMVGLLKDADDAELVALSRYYAGLTAPAPTKAGEPAMQERGKQLAETLRCASCHGAKFEGQDQIARLSGQRVDYLIAALKAFRDGTRGGADAFMSDTVAGLSDAELSALASYAASR